MTSCQTSPGPQLEVGPPVSEEEPKSASPVEFYLVLTLPFYPNLFFYQSGLNITFLSNLFLYQSGLNIQGFTSTADHQGGQWVPVTNLHQGNSLFPFNNIKATWDCSFSALEISKEVFI